jgi:DNA polymerase-4
METKPKKIIHFDMDYFYAQVEIRDNPSLKDRPVGIGGTKSRRGVLCTCNYIARKYGVRSAMPTYMAVEKCPELILLKPNFKKYKEASNTIFDIFHDYTDLVQGLSLDEAYLDVTATERCHNSATLMAREIKERIYKETGLTGSAGVSYNKLLAKISSDLNKPNGLTVFTPENIEEKIKDLSVKRIWGVGQKSFERMQKMGISTFGDLQQMTKLDLINKFGSFGPSLYSYSRGIDHRDVVPYRERKSLSVERTFSENLVQVDAIKDNLRFCFGEMKERLGKHMDRMIKNIFIKIKYADFKQTTIESPYQELSMECFEELFLKRFSQRIDPIRLIGTGVRFYPQGDDFQLQLPLL